MFCSYLEDAAIGELRLPADLDLGSCPTVKDCGRSVGAEQLQHGWTCSNGFTFSRLITIVKTPRDP